MDSRCDVFDMTILFILMQMKFAFTFTFTTCFPDYGLRDTENNAYAKFWVTNKEHYVMVFSVVVNCTKR